MFLRLTVFALIFNLEIEPIGFVVIASFSKISTSYWVLELGHGRHRKGYLGKY